MTFNYPDSCPSKFGRIALESRSIPSESATRISLLLTGLTDGTCASIAERSCETQSHPTASPAHCFSCVPATTESASVA